MTAISTYPTDLWVLAIGFLAVVGLLALARWLPPVWPGDGPCSEKPCDCPPYKRRAKTKR